MTRYILFYAGFLLLLFACIGSETKQLQPDRLTDFVDPYIGTASHGHTYPGAAYPFGQIQLSPDNGTQGWAADQHVFFAVRFSKPIAKSEITHAEIMNGGTLEFTMGAEPNYNLFQ